MKKFEKDGHIVFHGDCIEILRNKVDDESIDLIFADPPYNIGKDFGGFIDKWEKDEQYLNWCYEWLSLCIQKLKPTGSLYVMTSTQFMPYFDLYLRNKLTILSRLVWYYDSSGVQAKKYYGSTWEPILHCVKNQKKYTFNSKDILVEAKTGSKRKLIDYRKNPPQPYNTEKIPGNVWEFPRVRYRMEEYEDHPSQKPTALLERIIKASSNKNDIVLDPFSGTFTTSYTAKILERKSIGIELTEQYVKVGLRRLEIQKMYNGEQLVKPLKSYQKNELNEEEVKYNPTLFDING